MDGMHHDAPMVGHNEPPPDPFDVAKKRVEDLVAAANIWITSVPEITSEEQAGKASDFKNQLAAMISQTDTDRLAATKPLRDEQAAINTKFGTLAPFLTTARQRMLDLLGPWFKKLDDEKAAREAAARAEAKRLADEAAELAAKASTNTGDVIGNTVAAQVTATAAADALKEADRIANQKVQVRGDYSARPTGTRGQWKAEIKDLDKAFKSYRDNPKVADLLISLASADARGGSRRISGFTIFEERKVA